MIVIKHPITDRLINRLLLKSNERKLKIEEEDNPPWSHAVSSSSSINTAHFSNNILAIFYLDFKRFILNLNNMYFVFIFLFVFAILVLFANKAQVFAYYAAATQENQSKENAPYNQRLRIHRIRQVISFVVFGVASLCCVEVAERAFLVSNDSVDSIDNAFTIYTSFLLKCAFFFGFCR